MEWSSMNEGAFSFLHPHCSMERPALHRCLWGAWKQEDSYQENFNFSAEEFKSRFYNFCAAYSSCTPTRARENFSYAKELRLKPFTQN
jgi:hypothetical protein